MNRSNLSALRWQLPVDPSAGATDSLQTGSLEFVMAHPMLGYVGVVLILSIITFLVYGWDKRQAKNDGWRIPEKRLHLMALLGGWPGAMVGQNYFRHKTQKLEFKIVTWGAAGLHLVLVCWYLYHRMTG